MVMSRSQMGSQLTGGRRKAKRQSSLARFKSTGNDASDLAIIRGARDIDDGGVSRMKRGGKTESRVNEAGNYTKPAMRKRLFEKIKAGGKGGKPGQWSARKAQMLAREYKAAGGGYRD